MPVIFLAITLEIANKFSPNLADRFDGDCLITRHNCGPLNSLHLLARYLVKLAVTKIFLSRVIPSNSKVYDIRSQYYL